MSAAQKAAATYDLTGMMNFVSFRKAMTEELNYLAEGQKVAKDADEALYAAKETHNGGFAHL